MSKELTVDKLYRALKPLLKDLARVEVVDSPRSLRVWRLIYRKFHGRALDIYEQYPGSDLSQSEHDRTSEPDAQDEDPSQEERLDPSPEHDGNEEAPDEEDVGEKGKEMQKLSRKQVAHLKLVKRAEKIIGALEQAHVSSQELLQLITSDSDLKKEQDEDLALGMLLRGFEQPQRSTWGALIRDRTGKGAESIIAFCESSTSFDGKDKLLDRDENLLQSKGQSMSLSYLSQLLYKIDTIKFAWEWNSQRGPGSLNQKHAYNVALFQRLYPSHFRGLSSADKNNKMKELKSEYGKWMQSREGQITARNQLLKAWDNFGTGVLILPFFSVQNLGPRRAKNFSSLLDVLNNLAPQVEDEEEDEDEEEEHAHGRRWTRSRLDELEEENRAVIYNLTGRLCRSEEEKAAVVEFLDQFYAAYPSKVSS